MSGQCGFKMVVNENRRGEWTLIADMNNNTMVQSSIRIKVQDGMDLKPETVGFFGNDILRVNLTEQSFLQLGFFQLQTR